MEDNQLHEESIQPYKQVREDSFTRDAEDDMYLEQKRYHLVGETPCHLKIGDVLCGYLYKSIDDFNNHIKSFHLNEGQIQMPALIEHSSTEKSKESETEKRKVAGQLFESPETSPSEKRAFDFEHDKLLPNSQYESIRSNNTSKKNQYTISTPPLTPLEQPKHDFKNLPNFEQNVLSFATHKSSIGVKDLTTNQPSDYKLQISEPNKTDRKLHNEIQERKDVAITTQALYVDIETEPQQKYRIKEASAFNTEARQLLQVAPRITSPVSTYHHLSNQENLPIPHKPITSLPSSHLSTNLSGPPNSDNTSIVPPPPYYAASNYLSAPYVSKPESGLANFSNFPQAVNHSHQFPPSFDNGYSMFNPSGYNQPIQMSQDTTSYINSPSQPLSSMVHGPDHLHGFQKLQQMQQFQNQQRSDWRLLNNTYHNPLVNNPNSQSNFTHSNPLNILDNSSASLQSIPQMIYGTYGSAQLPAQNWQNSLEMKLQQRNNMLPESLHPLNPLIQQVQAIVNKHPRKLPRYSSIPSTNSIFSSSNITQSQKIHDIAEKRKCSATSEHKCLLSNCCGQGKRGGKRKRVQEKENLNSQQLEEMRSMEWEKREGYKCKVCDIRFANQQLLIDHLSENMCKRNVSE